ncbi:MAG: peptide deformylase [Saprospiraceae bacterium]|nr:peptide deformylase [Saprospiraceae bacterium]
MVLPIVLYGNPVLQRKAQTVDPGLQGLSKLIEDMWETMYFAKGVGLAAPQVGMSLRLFVVDSRSYYGDEDGGGGMKKVFINAELLDASGANWNFEEGCLSIPKINADVERRQRIRLRYFDQQFEMHEEEFDDMNARIILHEYDHIEGVLFIERINPLRRRMLQSKLDKIRKGMANASYPVKQ